MPNKLPAGWQEKKIGEIFSFIKNYSNSRAELNDYDDISYIHYGDIHKHYRHRIECDKVDFPKISAEKLSKNINNISYVENGDLIVVDASEDYEGTCISAEIKNLNYKLVSGLHTFLLRDENKFFADGYRGYIFYNNDVHRQCCKVATGISVYGISQENLKNIKIMIPPLDEQKRIADILSLCDDAIENLNTLIEKKEIYKKGVMQKVLTGEVRFKGFKDEWQTVKLGDLATITSAGVDKKINSDEKEVRLLNYLDVFNRNKLYDNEISFITSANDTQIEKCNIKKGDLFITPSSEDREGIAKSAVAMEDFNNVVYSYHIIRLRFNKEVDLKFKSYMCDTELFHRQAYRLCDGSGQRYVISLGTFREMEIYIPKSIEEQKRIGELLSAIDDDIDNLKKLLELRKQQKKGLMQRLLTGEIRV